MDPTACAIRALDALEAGDAFEAFDAASDLMAWLNKGGFPPIGCTEDQAWELAREIMVAAVTTRIVREESC